MPRTAQTITYQGEQSENGVPKNGTIDIVAKFFDVEQGGAALDLRSFEDVPVSRGLFTLPITLDNLIFFEGGDWRLEISVREGALSGAAPHTPLLPRQPVTSVPYAIHADAVDGMDASALTMQAPGKTGYKSTLFVDEDFRADGSLEEFGFLTLVAPAHGTLAARARGHCLASTGNEVVRGEVLIGTRQAEAVADSAATRGSLDFLANSSEQGSAFTAERRFQVNAGPTLFLATYGRRVVGSAGLSCSGTMSAEFFPASL